MVTMIVKYYDCYYGQKDLIMMGIVSSCLGHSGYDGYHDDDHWIAQCTQSFISAVKSRPTKTGMKY